MHDACKCSSTAGGRIKVGYALEMRSNLKYMRDFRAKKSMAGRARTRRAKREGKGNGRERKEAEGKLDRRNGKRRLQ
jgi:hypothetical protein